MRYIGSGRRFVALLIDTLITAIAWVPFAETESREGVTSISWQGPDFVVPALITLAYFVLLEGLAGATIGKAVLGIRVRRPDGSRIDLGAAVVRNLARAVDAFPYVIPYLAAAVAVSRSDSKQRLGDRWANTVVILSGTEGAGDGVAPPAADASVLPSPPPGGPPPGEPAPAVGSGDLPPPPPG
jgi:uncharacterized RDD family membrane protein YckC